MSGALELKKDFDAKESRKLRVRKLMSAYPSEVVPPTDKFVAIVREYGPEFHVVDCHCLKCLSLRA